MIGKVTRILVVLQICLGFCVSAQTDTLLGTYFIHSKIDEDCSADLMLSLFKEESGMDRYNEVILDHLLRGYYDPLQSPVNLKNFYANKTIDPTGELVFNMGGSCSFHKGGIYSFIACPYNVCDKAVRSNFGPNMITLDIAKEKVLKLEDVIDPARRDSFEKYIYETAVRYHIRNVPSCYLASVHPIQVRGSNNIVSSTDTITYQKGLTDKFYISEDRLYVFCKARHRDYTYEGVEVMTPLFYARYFLRPDFAQRIGIQ
jgi:hypothetical protein